MPLPAPRPGRVARTATVAVAVGATGHLGVLLLALTDLRPVDGADGRNVLLALVFLAPVIGWLAAEAAPVWGVLRCVRRDRPPGRPRVVAPMSGVVLLHILCATIVARSDGPSPVLEAYVAAHVAVAVLAAVAAVPW